MKKYIVRLEAEERARLEQTVRSGKRAAYLVRHANILLAVDESQTGKKMSRIKVVGEDFQFIGGKDSGGGGSGGSGGSGGGESSSSSDDDDAPRSRPPQRQGNPPVRQESNAFPPGLDEEDEIPF